MPEELPSCAALAGKAPPDEPEMYSSHIQIPKNADPWAKTP